MDSPEVRRCTDQDWPAVQLVDEAAFGYTGDDEEDAPERAVLELDRSLLAYVDGEPVGHTTAHSLDMSVPGGLAVAVAGVTWVAVLPTHRRRGVLTALMREQLQEIRERGEPVAALYASEPAIYGRFGYGLASQRYDVTVKRAYAAVEDPGGRAAGLRTRLMTPAQARPQIEEVYAAARLVRAGVPARPPKWWERCMNDPKGRREGASELRSVVVSDDGGPRAYAVFSTNEHWSEGVADTKLSVMEHAALDLPAAAALWQLLLGVDLVSRVVHWNLAVDDVLLTLLRNPRAAQPTLRDSLYVRLVDLPAALAARRYDVAYQGVVDVADPLAPWNAGRWELSLGPQGADCRRTEAEPDLTLDIAELGAAYLGGTSLVALAAAGRVTEHRAGAAAQANRAFRHEPAPHCPFVF